MYRNISLSTEHVQKTIFMLITAGGNKHNRKLKHSANNYTTDFKADGYGHGIYFMKIMI